MQGPSLVTWGGSVRGLRGVKKDGAPLKLGWLRKISGDRTKGETMSEMHEKKQPASKTKVRDSAYDRRYKKDGKCETKIASKEKEKRER